MSPCNKLILIGDFNFPDIDWDSLSGDHHHSNIFCDIVYRFNLLQYVEQPTHKMGNILDLVLSNDTDLVKDLSIDSSQNHSPLSDHFKISFKVPTASPPPSGNTQSRYAMNYSKADWMGLTSYLLDYDFSHFYSINDIDTLWSLLKQVLLDSAQLFVPKFKVKATQNPKWFNSEIRHELNCIHSLRRAYRKSPSPANSLKLDKAESLLQDHMKQAKSQYESDLVQGLANGNSNKIYQYIRSLKKQDSFPATMHLDATHASIDTEKASLFNKFFHSVFSTTNYVLPPTTDLPIPESPINDVVITVSDIFNTLSSLDPSKASGLDGIGSNLLKYCAIAICNPLHHLFSLCLSQHYVPNEWKFHCITPFFKSGDKASIKNYRPISLLSCTSKVLECIIYSKVIDHITDTVITKHQFGFLSNRSSTQQLLTFIHSIYSSHSDNAFSDTIYLDISKAFDSVSHPELLLKLWSSGITGNLWLWFKSYLSDRRQCVSINGHHSDFQPVLSGVPQGSILGPLLFIIYINDLPTSITSSLALIFADDTKCSKGIHSFIDTICLQNYLDAISSWSKDWNLTFKCTHFRLLSTSDAVPHTYVSH